MSLCWVSLCWVSICWVSLCWVSSCWVSLCWVSLCWVSLCWVSLCWVSSCWVSWHLLSISEGLTNNILSSFRIEFFFLLGAKQKLTPRLFVKLTHCQNAIFPNHALKQASYSPVVVIQWWKFSLSILWLRQGSLTKVEDLVRLTSLYQL